MMNRHSLIFLAFTLASATSALAQTRSTAQPGAWNLTATWGVATAGEIPNASNSDSIIVNHAITIPAGYSVTVDGMRVGSAGQVTVNGTGTLLLANVTDAIKVRGGIVAQNNSTISSPSASALRFVAGGLYTHGHTTNEGVIPLATWNSNSTMLVSGYTTATTATGAGNWGQSFANVTWNCASQGAVFDLQGQLNTVTGTLTISNTGANSSRQLILTSLTGVDQLNVGRDFIVSGSARVSLETSATGQFVVNVGRNVGVNTSGYLRFATDGEGTLNVSGNVDLDGGTITEVGNGTGNFIFQNGRLHNFRRGATGLSGALSGRINYIIQTSDTLDLDNAVLHYGGSGSNANAFELSGTIRLGSTDILGALQNSTGRGNIQTTTANRVWNSGCKIIYRSSSPQFIQNGNGVPTGVGTTTIIDNAAGVSLALSVNISGELILANGSLNISASRTLTLSGNVSGSGFFGGTPTSTLVISGTSGGNIGTLLFDPSANSLGTLTVDRTGPSASVIFGNTVTVAGQLNLTNGVLQNSGGISAGNGALVTRYPSASLSIQRLSNTSGESYNVQYRTTSAAAGPFAKIITGLELPVSAESEDLGSLIINLSQNSDTVQLSQDIIINGSLNLDKGRFFADTRTIVFEGSSWEDDGGSFVAGTGTVLFNGVTNVEGTSTTSFNNLSVSSTGSATFIQNPIVLGNINFQSGSTISASTTTFTLNGSASQTISASGNLIGNLAIAKTGGTVSLTSALSVIGLVRFNVPSENINLMSNGFLTLTSPSDAPATTFGGGMIYRLQNGNTVSGSITVERFMSGEGRIYRYISSPVDGATVASLKDDFPVTGNFVDPSPISIACGYKVVRSDTSMWYYNEDAVGDIETGWVPYPAPGTTAAGSPLVVGRGYAAFIRRCGAPTIIDLSGTANQGAIPLPVTYRNTGDATADGWNLVGNPFPCTIDWDQTGSQGWTKTRVSNTIAIKDNGTGMFRYWDGDGNPADIANGHIAIGQAFWVRATAANPILTVREGTKVTNVGEFFRAPASPASVITISLEKGGIVDRAYVKLKPSAKATLDTYDAPKMDNVLFDLATLSDDGIPMAINAVKKISCDSPLRLVTKDMSKGTYTINFETLGNFSGFTFMLKDAFLNSEAIVGASGYTFDVTDEMSSKASNRFTVVLIEKAINADISVSLNQALVCSSQQEISVILSESQDGVTYQLWNENGEILSETLTTISDSLHNGINTIKVKAISGCQSEFVGEELQIVRETAGSVSVQGASACQQGAITLVATPDNAAYNVVWYESITDEEPIFTGSEFLTGTINKSKTYYAAATSSAGCVGARVPVEATIVNFDPIQITIQPGNTLHASLENGLQWYLNDVLIAGANAQTIVARETGTYSVRATIDGCTTEDNYDFVITGIEEDVALKLYPNPTERFLYVSSSVEKNAIIMNSLGQIIGKINISSAEDAVGVFDFSGYPAGVYFVRFSEGTSNKKHYRVIKK